MEDLYYNSSGQNICFNGSPKEFPEYIQNNEKVPNGVCLICMWIKLQGTVIYRFSLIIEKTSFLHYYLVDPLIDYCFTSHSNKIIFLS